MDYTHLTKEERYQICILKKTGMSHTDIGKVLNRSTSTISREVARNSGLRGYRPEQAHDKAKARKANNARQISAEDWLVVEEKIMADWSPEQISGRLGLASHESIYQHIYKDKRNNGGLHSHLRCRKQKRKRYGKNSTRGQIINRRDITDRPAVVDERSRVGDWEADTIIGKGHKQALVSLVERKSGFTLLAKVRRKTAEKVSSAITSLLKPYPFALHTITADNGKEFAWHEQISRELNADFFFARPYASWQRGSNENTNGLVRQYLPKKQSFEDITDEHIDWVMHKLNNRPRKRLGFRTPKEVFWSDVDVALRT